jgi:hypothetical protein
MSDPIERWLKIAFVAIVLAPILGVGYWLLQRQPPAGATLLARPYFVSDTAERTAAQKNAFGLFDTSAQRTAFRVVLVAIGVVVLALTLGLIRPRCPRLLRGGAAWAVHLWGPARVGRSRWVCAALLILLVLRLAPAVRKAPDFSAYDPALMAVTNMHLTMTLSHADRLAAGDVLFRDTTPKYGLLFPVVVGAAERAFGLFGLGTVYRVLIAVGIIYLVIAAYLYLKWSRRRWPLCLLPFVLLLPYYYCGATIAVPPNHTALRTLGIWLAPFVLFLVRSVRPVWQQFMCGVLCALAVLANLESGVAASAGVVAFAFCRFGPCAVEKSSVPFLLARMAAGFLVVLVGFALFCRLALGAAPDLAGLARYAQFVRLSAGAMGSFPYQGSLWQAVVWPVVMLTHVAAVLVHTALSRPFGFRKSFRAAVCVTFLVWFAYYVNRPHPEYLCSYWFLYGFILLDSGRYVLAAIRRPRTARGPEVALLAVLGLVILPMGYAAMEWHYNPMKWAVKTQYWGVPLLAKGVQPNQPSAYVGKAYLPLAYAQDLTRRADYLRHKADAAGGRVVYFTVDSYLMPRVSGVLSWQEFPDPVEALDRATYHRLLESVFASGQREIYVDARDAGSLVWYGTEVFTLLRNDLAACYRLERVEEGWEVWVRDDGSAGSTAAR